VHPAPSPESLVSVVIPTYNRRHLIGRALQSVFDQTVQDFEVLVVDDGSTDGTPETVAALGDPRVKILRHAANRGAQAARNTGIRAAIGQYVAFLDSDDTWMRDKLERQLACFATAKPDLGVVHAPCLVQADDASLARAVDVPPLRGVVYAELLASPGPVFPALLVRRECFEDIGLLDESLPAYQEWDTVIRLARRYAFDWVPVPLVTYHLHAADAISRNWVRNAEGYLRVVTVHREEILATCGPRTLSRHYAVIADHYVRGGRMDLARGWFRRSLEVDRRNLRALAGLALTFVGPRRYLRVTAALKAFRTASTGAKLTTQRGR
jgi:glycosyltransferase involved in cell wall biosynthesis